MSLSICLAKLLAFFPKNPSAVTVFLLSHLSVPRTAARYCSCFSGSRMTECIHFSLCASSSSCTCGRAQYILS